MTQPDDPRIAAERVRAQVEAAMPDVAWMKGDQQKPADLTDEQVAELVTRPDMPALTQTVINLAKRQRNIT